MNVLNRNTVQADSYTERILQFGEGNFLRAFANWMLHEEYAYLCFKGYVPRTHKMMIGFEWEKMDYSSCAYHYEKQKNKLKKSL